MSIKVYYRDAAAAFVVFDLTRIATFEAAAKWKDDLDMKVQTRVTIMGDFPTMDNEESQLRQQGSPLWGVFL